MAVLTLFILWGPSRGEEMVIVPEEQASTSPGESGELVIDIAGGILQPGVYKLPSGSILEDAILMAGGFSSQADLSVIEREINRAQLLEDHSKVYIPKIGDQFIASLPLPSGSSSSSPLTGSPAALININSASLAELDTLPGIGPATAQNILDFKKLNGPFTKKEDLKLVPGIGESKYEKIKELITL